MLYLKLFYEFLQVGLFSVGGGLATIPFLRNIGLTTGWFDEAQLANMIAISESTPGPLGVNMATYVGYECGGVLGAIVASIGLITPSIIVILIIAGFLQKFRQSKAVESTFYGLRPASVALITAAGISVAVTTFLYTVPEYSSSQIHYPSVILAIAVYVAMTYTPMKKLHPIAFIAISAVIGILFQF